MSFLPNFSHIYVEDGAKGYSVTSEILQRFSRADVVSIQNYKEIFNRPRQRWDHQRESIKLILAVRKDSFLYPGSSFVPNFAHHRFFYTTPVINCIYGCEYCYLQGMFPSANMVVFVNVEDFIGNAQEELKGDPSYLCISYDTDLLALEDLLGYCRPWIDFAHENPQVTLELRTKSSNFRALSSSTPPPNFILAWTLSPDEIISTIEHRTPSLEARCRSIREAQAKGWTVRLCLDPLLLVGDWHSIYRKMIERVASLVDMKALCDISIGTFRINGSYLRNMQDRNPRSRLLAYPYAIENGSASYPEEKRDELVGFVANELRRYVSEEMICPVPWQ